LRKFLESDDPAMRRMGLSMAKGSGVPEPLYKNVFGLSLWDPEAENREAAAELVEDIGLENITEFPGWLEPFEEEEVDWEVRRYAVKALGKSGDERAVEPLINALKDNWEEYGEWNQHLSVYDNAAWVLGDIGDERAIEPLIEALDSKLHHAWDYWDSKQGPGVVHALGEIGDARAVEPLIEALGPNVHFGVRRGAAVALGDIGDARAVEPLIRELSCDWDDMIRRFAAIALGKIGDERAVEPLNKVLKDKERHVCRVAARALGQIGDARAGEPLIKALGDGSRPDVSSCAAEALGKIGDTRAVEPLITALGDEDAYVRDAAKEALKKLGHEVK
jgi:HEAT repeat protein